MMIQAARNKRSWPRIQLHQRGLTLVELMIAMVIALFLMAGVIQMFSGSKQTYRLQDGLARLQENARFSLDVISNEVRLAGYMGCYANGAEDLVNTLNITDYEHMLDTALTGFEGSGSSTYTPSTGAIWTAVPEQIRNAVASIPADASASDIITIRRVDDQGLRLASNMPNTSADLKAVNGSGTPPDDCDILLISDCQRSALFQTTNVTVPGGNGDINIVHNTGTCAPGNSTKLLVNSGDPFGTDAAIYRMATTTFYVAPSDINNIQGDTVLSLWRKEVNEDPQELVAGVESMQFLYGIDSDDDGVPNYYARAGAEDLDDAVAIRIDLVVNTIDEATSNGDGLVRRNFGQTIRIRN